MKSFEEIAGVWLESEIFGKQYSYRKGIEKDVEHLINYFGARNCEEIKGMDVDKFIQYETENVNIIPLIKLEKFQSNGKNLSLHKNVEKCTLLVLGNQLGKATKIHLITNTTVRK